MKWVTKEDGVSVPKILAEYGYTLSPDGIHWCYRGERGESRLAIGALEGLLRESGARRLRLHIQQEKARCQ